MFLSSFFSLVDLFVCLFTNEVQLRYSNVQNVHARTAQTGQHFRRNDRLLFQESSVFTQNSYPKPTKFSLWWNGSTIVWFACARFFFICARTVNKTAYLIQYSLPVHYHILMFMFIRFFIFTHSVIYSFIFPEMTMMMNKNLWNDLTQYKS